jgi:hypothetical protein
MRPYHCYYCQKPVPKDEHANVRRVLEELWMTAMTDDIEGVTPESSFVHMTGALPSNLDDEGNVVVCAADAIREMAENIQPAEG